MSSVLYVGLCVWYGNRCQVFWIGKSVSHCPQPVQLFLGLDIWAWYIFMRPAVHQTPLGATHYIHATPPAHPPHPVACWDTIRCHPISQPRFSEWEPSHMSKSYMHDRELYYTFSERKRAFITLWLMGHPPKFVLPKVCFHIAQKV